MILNISNLNKTYIDKHVLKDVSFHIDDNEKCAIVGINGSGKTTLLRCITGTEEADSGIIALGKDKHIGYLAQQHADMEHDDEEYNSLSGGQKTRKRLEEILEEKPDLLILDEPTNHLDLDSIQWLEKMIRHYKGAVLLVSHDRYFLDRTVSKIIDLDNGKARMYKGNYSEYAAKKKMVRDSELKAYINQQEEIKHQEAVIEKLKSFNREKSIKRAESREKALDKIDLLEKPEDMDNEMRLVLRPNILSGKDVLDVENLTKAFGDNLLFKDATFHIKRGEHVAITGGNGSGKTTLLQIINGLLDADFGTISLGSKVHIAYYDQEHAVLNMEKTVFDEIHDTYPEMNNSKVRNVLAAFMFKNDDVFKRIEDLSGGEQGRVSLAKIMLSSSNFLILDEPTNHLDIQGKEVLEDAINNYEGTVLYVSHDRYFINKTADRILELYNMRFDNYIGNYDYYMEKRDDVRRYGDLLQIKENPELFNQTEVEAIIDDKSEGRMEWEKQKELKNRQNRAENDLKKTEKKIHSLEEKIEELESEMLNPEYARDAAKLIALHKEKEEIDTTLLSLYEKWEELSIELEELSSLL